VEFGEIPTFRRFISPPSSGSRNKKPAEKVSKLKKTALPLIIIIIIIIMYFYTLTQQLQDPITELAQTDK
jgi:hypothetical protein